MYKLLFKKSAFAEFRKLPLSVRRRLADALQVLQLNPYNRALNIKKLKGIDALYRLRVGDYRVLYDIEGINLSILIVRVGHRKDVYE